VYFFRNNLIIVMKLLDLKVISILGKYSFNLYTFSAEITKPPTTYQIRYY